MIKHSVAIVETVKSVRLVYSSLCVSEGCQVSTLKLYISLEVSG